MPLTNFGSILNFAEKLENEAAAFYDRLAGRDACADIRETLGELVRSSRKNIQVIQRTRRENVTEMILEPIKDFTREPFQAAIEDSRIEGADSGAALLVVKQLEGNAERYYLEAAQKIRALPEVARALKTLAKKHAANLKKLDTV